MEQILAQTIRFRAKCYKTQNIQRQILKEKQYCQEPATFLGLAIFLQMWKKKTLKFFMAPGGGRGERERERERKREREREREIKRERERKIEREREIQFLMHRGFWMVR
jgi:hypothetical protein